MSTKGFTLPELLVAFVISSILAAIAIPATFNQINKAKIAKAEYFMRGLYTPLWEFRVLEGRFPYDVNANEVPEGLEGYWSDDVDGFDYEHHGLGDGRCLVMITWFGLDGVRQSSVFSSESLGDDRILKVAEWECLNGRGSVRN